MTCRIQNNPGAERVTGPRHRFARNRRRRTGAVLIYMCFGMTAFAAFVSGHWVFVRSKRAFADLL